MEMDAKVFSDESVSRLLNENFVCVRVDRDEYPHIDRLFQLVVGGGYPVNCVLTADRRVIVAANFLTRDGSAGEVGLLGLLKRVAQLWRSDRASLLKSARGLGDVHSNPEAVRLTPALVDDTVVRLLMDYDWDMGGVGLKQPRRFPQPTVNKLLLAYSSRSGDTLGAQATSISLRKMYYGGIMDQVGGGFHRNADSEWLVPSFEKLLLDNVEVALDYANMYMATRDEEFLDALNLTLNFIVSDLRVEGGFAASVASDGEHEGEYYTWTPREVEEALGPQLGKIGRELFGVHPIAVSADPYSPKTEATRGVVSGRIVLRRALDLDDLSSRLGVGAADAWKILGDIRSKMRAYRDQHRRKPKLDAATYTRPNMTAVEALLTGHAVVGGNKRWLNPALSVLEGVGRRITRRLKGGREGLAEDYGATLNALITAYEVTGTMGYLDKSVSVAKTLSGLLGETGFRDERRGEIYVASKLDSPNESTNSLCIRGILRLSLIIGDQKWLGVLGDMFPRALGGLKAYKDVFLAGLYLNLDRFINGGVHVVVVDVGDTVADGLHGAAMRAYHPFKVVERVGVDALRDHPNPRVRGLTTTAKSVAYVRRGFNSEFTESATDTSRLLSILATVVSRTYNY
jgi:uncharacterized protein YyaL (SSP411 family)